MPTLADLPDVPKYRIASACAQTGIEPVTLRAWERRYCLLKPQRSGSNYRLYSERDVALLRWVKRQLDDGVPISRAVADWQELRRAGRWPEVPPALPKLIIAEPPCTYAARLYGALKGHDERAANKIFDEAYAVLDIVTLCGEVVTPCLAQIGHEWAQGNLRIATEHFASGYLRGRLLTLFQSSPLRRNGARILAGSGTGELHDIGSLIFALLLRRDGYQVEFLGADVQLDDLLAYAREARPALICLSANSRETALNLARLSSSLLGMRPRPKFGFGGAAFTLCPELQTAIAGTFLGENVLEARAAVRKLLDA
jgi:MerR family transcriptional regulator, light-induced transcriptional regulator